MSKSINRAEIAHFAQHSNDWWNENGKFKPLHAMNPVRLEFITNSITAHFSKPLSALSVLDCGCGGGLLSEPMARLGARVTGIDADAVAIRIAADHADAMGLDIDYRCGAIENENRKFDVVLALEIIEHVDDPDYFIGMLKKRLKPDGLLFISTINRTPISYAGAIIAAERILNWAPRGTHDWNKFITPDEMADLLRSHKLKIQSQCGMVYHPILRQWQLRDRMDINYILCASL